MASSAASVFVFATERMLMETEAVKDPGLTAALEAALARELLSTWKQLNLAYFKGKLVAPTLHLVPYASRLGLWRRDTRTIEIARPFVLAEPWGAVVEVLKHEMAHQYVHEVLGESGETAHGPAFRATCARLGIDERASGVPRGHTADAGEARSVQRIAKLLVLAESANRSEAEAAAAAAQRLMLKYNLEVHGKRDYAHRHLGRPSGRVGEAERLLAMILGKHFFVEVIWVPVYRAAEGKRGSVLEICGTHANLAMAEYVHGYLLHAGEQLWEQHRRAHGVRGNRDRRTFLAGVMSGFAEKLARQTAVNKEQGLVWVKDGELSDFLRRRHPYIRHVRHDGHRRNEAFARGKEAGRALVLRKGVGAADAPTARGRLLPPAR